MTLTEFLLERIAEDEAVLDEALWYHDLDGKRIRPMQDEPVEQTKARVFRRQVAECESKRRILGVVKPALDAGNDSLRPILYALALPYADHPDFDPFWRA